LLRGQFSNQDDADYVRSLTQDGQKVYLVTARRLYKSVGTPIDQHQMDGLWCLADTNGRITPVDGLL
jgi:hypothetical protein